MLTGNFQNTGEPLIVAAEGILNSGQHRLLALVEADVELDMDVRFGIPRDVFALTDTGSSRTPRDVATIRQLPNGADVATAVRLLVLYERGLPGSIREYVSNDEVNRAITRWIGIVDIIERVKAAKIPRMLRGGPIYAAAYLASLSPGRSKLDKWLEILSSGLTTDNENPAYLLRERILNGLESPLGSRELLLERFALMNKSWNLFRSGQSIPRKAFKWKSTGNKPEPFPLVTGAKLPEAGSAEGGA